MFEMYTQPLSDRWCLLLSTKRCTHRQNINFLIHPFGLNESERVKMRKWGLAVAIDSWERKKRKESTQALVIASSLPVIDLFLLSGEEKDSGQESAQI